MTPRRALITGITGQDGSYLAELLLEKGYTVYGMVRRASSDHFARIAHLQDRIQLREGDLLDQLSLITLLHETEPHEVYNLAAQSFVPTSWTQPVLTAEFTVRPAHNPIGPFDFAGGYDDRSQRQQGLGELMNRGYEDAYHQFIEPIVGASGEHLVRRLNGPVTSS